MTYSPRFASLFLVAPLLVSVAACGGGTSGTTGTGGATGSTSGTGGTTNASTTGTGTGGTMSTSTAGTGGTMSASIASSSGTTGTGGAPTCGATTCKAGEVCFAKSGGALMEPACVADPCAPQPLSCACADTLCGGTLYVCSVVGQTVHCDCNTCP